MKFSGLVLLAAVSLAMVSCGAMDNGGSSSSAYTDANTQAFAAATKEMHYVLLDFSDKAVSNAVSPSNSFGYTNNTNAAGQCTAGGKIFYTNNNSYYIEYQAKFSGYKTTSSDIGLDGNVSNFVFVNGPSLIYTNMTRQIAFITQSGVGVDWDVNLTTLLSSGFSTITNSFSGVIRTTNYTGTFFTY